MKKMMTALMAMLTIAVSASAMSYEQARNEALFLTDKMAYELNLSDAQYEAAYEINLDYLMGVTSYDDVYGAYWERRNLDLSYILFEWQWDAFRAASYFYRPLYWSDGFWHFGVYARYPHRDYFYFGRPVFYATYRGAHAWHLNGHYGYYYHHRDHFRPAPQRGREHFGMRDGWNRGDYRGNQHRGGRNSSTRTTVNRRNDNRYDNGRTSFGASRSGSSMNNREVRPQGNNRPSTVNTTPRVNPNRSFGASRSTTTAPSSVMQRSSSSVHSTAPRSSMSSSSPVRSSSSRSSSFGGSATQRSSSFGGSATRSSGSSSHSSSPSSRGGGFGSHR